MLNEVLNFENNTRQCYEKQQKEPNVKENNQKKFLLVNP